MAANLLAPGVKIKEEPPRLRTFNSNSSIVTGFLGITERGPCTPQQITSFAEYLRVYGGDVQDSNLTHAIRCYFENGGQLACIQRVVHYDVIDDPATKTCLQAAGDLTTSAGPATAAVACNTLLGPFDLSNARSFELDVDGAGFTTTAFTATPACVISGNAEPFALTNGDTLTVDVDGQVQTIIFTNSQFPVIAAATAAQVAAVINASLSNGYATVSGGAIQICSDSEGSASTVQVSGGTANAILGFPIALVAGSGNVADIENVTVAEIETILEAAYPGIDVYDPTGNGNLCIASGSVGIASSIQLNVLGLAGGAMGFDGDVTIGSPGGSTPTITIQGKTCGAYANDIEIQISPAASGDADDFNLDVYQNGLLRESFADLSMVPGSDNYFLDVIQNVATGSSLIDGIDLGIMVRPADGLYGPLTGGDDGLAGLTSIDFVGSEPGANGLRGFDNKTLDLLVSPDSQDPIVHNAMLTYAEVTRCGDLFAILDPPKDYNTAQLTNYVTNVAGLKGSSEFGAIYFPWVNVPNPNQQVFGADVELCAPPSGCIAGVIARNANARPGGHWDCPAGLEKGRLRGVTSLYSEDTQSDTKAGLLRQSCVNAIRNCNGILAIMGASTLKQGASFNSVHTRIGVNILQRFIQDTLKVFLFRANTRRLRASIQRQIRARLITEMNQGAFVSTVPSEAFQVNLGDDLNTPLVVCQNYVLAEVALATTTCAEFICITFRQDTRAKEEALAQG